MATTTTVTVLLITIILSLSTITTTARPCKTIFFITSTTTTSSYYPTTTIHPLQNPNPNPRLTFFITEIHHFHRTRPLSHHTFTHHSSQNDVVSSKPYFPSSSSSSPSILDRTMDIMSIVGALLFGVGCGALTAGTIYLVWSLFSSNRTIDFDSDDSDVESVDDDVTPKNNGGYVAVANKEVPPSADEVDAMKK